MIASSRSYAIGMVHFQIGGGWKVLAVVLGIYLALFGAGVALFYYADYMAIRTGGAGPRMAATVGPVIVGLLMGLQGLALLLIGGYRVSSAIRSDISSRMIESHRLMPITAANAVFGYLFGPTTPLTMFALLNLALSCIFGAAVGVSFERMAINQAVIFTFAVFVWSMVALGTFIYRHMFFIALAVMFLGSCSMILFYAFTAFPAFALLATPFIGETIFSVAGGTSTFDAGFAFGIAGQAALFLVFFAGACRLYRGTYRTVFSARQAMALLAVWATLSAIGIFHSNRLGFTQIFARTGEFDDDVGTVQVVASFASCIILSVIPLWSMLQEERQARQPALVRGSAVFVCAILAFLPAWGAGWKSTYTPYNMTITFFSILAQVFTLYLILRLTRSMRFIFAALITGGIFIALWVGPLILEVLRLAIMNGTGEASMSVLGTLSPLGLLSCLWGGVKDVSSLPGLVWQWFAVVIAWTISAAISGAKSRKPPASDPGAPPSPDNRVTPAPPLPASP